MLCHGGSVGGVIETVMIAVCNFQVEKIHSKAQTAYQRTRVELLVEHDLEIVVFLGKRLAEPVESKILAENGDIVETPCEQNWIISAECPEAFHGILKSFAVSNVLLGDAGEL